MPSLLSYLDDSTQCHLQVSLSIDRENDQHVAGFPFCLIHEPGPFSRLIKADWVTDAGSRIRNLFLLVQKDEYPVKQDELWPVTNKDIEQYWQNSFIRDLKHKSDDFRIVLADQKDSSGALQAFDPLFYCRVKKSFFHPPCPQCESPLQLCTDDELLSTSGLLSYSTSLKRYLYCPACAKSSQRPDFYVFRLEDTDSPVLKDRTYLINEFRQLTGSSGTGKTANCLLPCKKCSDLKICYGPENKASKRILPFSFYPFFMAIYHADSVHIMDFMSLVSGASVKELVQRLSARQQAGRISFLKSLEPQGLPKTGFFFRDSEKFFLESLYLKLSFLKSFAQKIFQGMGRYRHPDFGLSTDRIWVTFFGKSHVLPFFWNFDIRMMGIGGPTLLKYTNDIKLPPDYSLYFLGRMWFVALMANAIQDIGQVQKAVDHMLDSDSIRHAIQTGNFEAVEYSGSFSSQNSCWQPEENSILPCWEHLWKKALDLGWMPIRSCLAQNTEFVPHEFIRKLELLRQEIKEALFSDIPTIEPDYSNDREIFNILSKIAGKWKEQDANAINQKDLSVPDKIQKNVSATLDKSESEEDAWNIKTIKAPAPIDRSDARDWEEPVTVIVASTSNSLESTSTQSQKPNADQRGWERQTTMIITPENLEQARSKALKLADKIAEKPDVEPAPDVWDDDLTKTRVSSINLQNRGEK
ncbi:hypothetical protein QUF76_11520 [Desulfobacterales bacterium HSG16]|nr:hypothetical protein [Desulfobacterales bacterium HSG16]